ncbi:hypothetical protein EON66_06415 [archaeon]|nr:MAG: hypothetical protein EON66_06415 [archaeon]
MSVLRVCPFSLPLCSVVKQSSQALVQWAQAAAREGRVAELVVIAEQLVKLLQPRAIQAWDVLVEGGTLPPCCAPARAHVAVSQFTPGARASVAPL